MTYLNNDTEAFPMDDLGNRVGQVTQRDGVGNAHRNAASRHGVLRPDITATNRIHLSVNDMKNSVDELTNRYTAIDANSLAYDDAGSLTQDKDGYRTTYDYENRPVRIAKLDGQTEVTVATFAYDALGRRIRKVDAIAYSTSLYYYSDNWQVLAEYNGSGVLQASYAYGNYIDEVLLMRRGGADYFYLHDHLYSPAVLLSSSGAVVERYEYDVYGEVNILSPNYELRTNSSYANAYMFTGRELDTLDSGKLKKMHYRYRDYSVSIGRFYQEDPLQYVDGLNLYSYCGSNGINLYDCYGMSTWDVIKGGWRFFSALSIYLYGYNLFGDQYEVNSWSSDIEKMDGFSWLEKRIMEKAKETASNINPLLNCGESHGESYSDHEDETFYNNYAVAPLGRFTIKARIGCVFSKQCDSDCPCGIKWNCTTFYSVRDKFSFDDEEDGGFAEVAAGLLAKLDLVQRSLMLLINEKFALAEMGQGHDYWHTIDWKKEYNDSICLEK